MLTSVAMDQWSQPMFEFEGQGPPAAAPMKPPLIVWSPYFSLKVGLSAYDPWS